MTRECGNTGYQSEEEGDWEGRLVKETALLDSLVHAPAPRLTGARDMGRERRRQARNGAASARGGRLGRERPGVALHGPPLSVTCACGRKQALRFGDSWTCEGCGQVWDTSRIPRAEYQEIRRLQLRYRMLPVALGLVVVALAAFFTLTGDAGIIVLLLPIALLGWFVFLRDAHRRRYHRAIARRRTWTLRGER